jgi:phospholipid:diacylglycerol acyltransferase
MADAPDGTCAESDGTDCETPRPPLDLPLSKKSWIDYEFSDLNASPKILNGVKMGEGDGTVSLLSLGAMCVGGWKMKKYNPAGIKVTTIEVSRRAGP